MRKILFRGKRMDNGEWVYGNLVRGCDEKYAYIVEFGNKELCRNYVNAIPETVGQYTGLADKNETRIFEGDIVQYLTYDDFDCQSVVKFGEYKQDGSCGEYGARICLGFYVEVDNFTCPDWCENEPECFSDYQKQQNILEIANECEVIGNIYDNPELLGGNNNG